MSKEQFLRREKLNDPLQKHTEDLKAQELMSEEQKKMTNERQHTFNTGKHYGELRPKFREASTNLSRKISYRGIKEGNPVSVYLQDGTEINAEYIKMNSEIETETSPTITFRSQNKYFDINILEIKDIRRS